ncbi:MAG: response regulator [Deltaproteobacteria bacterium]|jgi:putative two-component system response regulator|nr:response regulator [Deltaproteobacteria bacterium]
MKEILIVDDNITNLKQISSFLEGKYRFSLAKSGQQALTICAHERPDLILLDVQMPGMNGFDTIARLKENPTLHNIPVIFITSNLEPATEIEGFRLGARDFIKKPVVNSVLIHRLALHLNISTYQTQLADSVKTLSDNLTASIAELIECRDENTGGHVVRTSQYFELLGRDLIERGMYPEQLSVEALNMMVRAAPLHDIGKISISDKILLKPDRLTDDEFNIMKTHTEVGARILKNMFARTPTQQYLKYAIMIAASHHERYDGNGYPTGASGENIPLCGRIMAIADVYDAVINDRVYRKGLSHAEVSRIITDGRGAQYDPCILDSFENCCSKFSELSSYRDHPS